MIEQGIVRSEVFKNTEYITLSFIENTNYVVFYKRNNHIHGASDDYELMQIIQKNNVGFTRASTNKTVYYTDKEIREIICEGEKLYFDIWKNNEEMIDFLCGHKWPKYMEEFVERVVLSLTKGN